MYRFHPKAGYYIPLQYQKPLNQTPIHLSPSKNIQKHLASFERKRKTFNRNLSFPWTTTNLINEINFHHMTTSKYSSNTKIPSKWLTVQSRQQTRKHFGIGFVFSRTSTSSFNTHQMPANKEPIIQNQKLLLQNHWQDPLKLLRKERKSLTVFGTYFIPKEEQSKPRCFYF